MLSTNNQYVIPGPEAQRPNIDQAANYVESSRNMLSDTVETERAPYLVDSATINAASVDALRAAEINKKEVNAALSPEAILHFAAGAGQRIVLRRNEAVLKQNSDDIGSLRHKDAA